MLPTVTLTPVGALSSAFASHVIDLAWLSSFGIEKKIKHETSDHR